MGGKLGVTGPSSPVACRMRNELVERVATSWLANLLPKLSSSTLQQIRSILLLAKFSLGGPSVANARARFSVWGLRTENVFSALQLAEQCDGD